jgi:hypothetical protein
MDPAGSAGAALEAARLLGGAGGGHMQHPSGLLMNPLLSLAHSSGGSQGLARMTSQEEAAASMRREPSSELRMGGVSLADLMQQCAAHSVTSPFLPMPGCLQRAGFQRQPSTRLASPNIMPYVTCWLVPAWPALLVRTAGHCRM